MPAVKPRRANRGRMEFLSPEELLAVLKVARERSTHDWAMILLAYRHGLRASEVCGLRLAWSTSGPPMHRRQRQRRRP